MKVKQSSLPFLKRHIAAATSVSSASFTTTTRTSAAINAPLFEQHSADANAINFPRERVGLNYDFNWSLNAHGVTPYGDAFYQSDMKLLKAHAGKRKDVVQFLDRTAVLLSKNIQSVESNDDNDSSDVVNDESSVSMNNMMSYEEYDTLAEKVKDDLSEVDYLYCQDGGVGAFSKDRSHIRVISDSPLVDLFAKNLLIKIPNKAKKHRNIVVYVATMGDHAIGNPQCGVYINKDAQEDKYTDASVVLSGIPDPQTLVDAIAMVKSKLDQKNTDRKTMVLPCDIIERDGEIVLDFTFSTSESNLKKGAHYAIWSEDGVTNLLGGAIVTKPDTDDDDSWYPLNKMLGSIDLESANIHPHPNMIVFSDGTTSKGLSAPELVSKMLIENPSIDAPSLEGILSGASCTLALGLQ